MRIAGPKGPAIMLTNRLVQILGSDKDFLAVADNPESDHLDALYIPTPTIRSVDVSGAKCADKLDYRTTLQTTMVRAIRSPFPLVARIDCKKKTALLCNWHC